MHEVLESREALGPRNILPAIPVIQCECAWTDSLFSGHTHGIHLAVSLECQVPGCVLTPEEIGGDGLATPRDRSYGRQRHRAVAPPHRPCEEPTMIMHPPSRAWRVGAGRCPHRRRSPCVAPANAGARASFGGIPDRDTRDVLDANYGVSRREELLLPSHVISRYWSTMPSSMSCSPAPNT